MDAVQLQGTSINDAKQQHHVCDTEQAPLLQPRNKHDAVLPMRHSAVDALFVRRLARLYGSALVPRWRSPETALLALLLVLAVGNEALTYFVGMLPSQLIVGLIQRDTSAFFSTLWRAALCTVGEALVISLIAWLTALLSMRWRRNLVTVLHERYLHARRFHAINQSRVDNPDQRVVQDATMLCTNLATILKSVAVPFVIVFYTWRVWALLGWSGPLTVYVRACCAVRAVVMCTHRPCTVYVSPERARGVC